MGRCLHGRRGLYSPPISSTMPVNILTTVCYEWKPEARICRRDFWIWRVSATLLLYLLSSCGLVIQSAEVLGFRTCPMRGEYFL
jgi:hypothetical protein